MTRTLSKDEILGMTPEQRLTLIDELWDSIVDAQEQLPVTAEERRLLDEALDEHRRNPEAARPWDQVRDEVFPKIRK